MNDYLPMLKQLYEEQITLTSQKVSLKCEETYTKLIKNSQLE